MPQIIRVIQCTTCRTFQCDIVKKDTKFECKLCNSRQTNVTEVFRGTGRECRIHCMKLNNQRMENDQGFNDLMPQDLMNESYRSDFDSSLLSNRSVESFTSPLPGGCSVNGTPTTETSACSAWSEFMEEDDSFGLQANDTNLDNKRKHSTVVSPYKDGREYKRPRPFSHLQAENSTSQSCPKLLAFHKMDKIRAQFKYQHLMDASGNCDQSTVFHASIGDENSTNQMQSSAQSAVINKTNGVETSSIWNSFLDAETME